MKRDATALTSDSFDVLVVGGGIYGAFAAWDAALRGLRVALIERGDFGSATSSNSLKIAHGGLRHLQRGDLAAVAQSLDEQITLRRIAPGLVHPLACVMEVGGGLRRNPAAVAAALGLYGAVGRARSRRLGADAAPETGRLLGQSELTQMVAPFETGWRRGAVWFDALIDSPERLLIAVVRAAVDAGAVAASYMEAQSFTSSAGGVTVTARSAGSSEPSEIRARIVLNAAGPWAPQLAARWGGSHTPISALASACNVVVHSPAPVAAMALKHPTEQRMLFAVPWRGRLMLGTSYAPATLSAGTRPRAAAVEQLLHDFNQAIPGAHLGAEDVALVHGGLLPSVPSPSARASVTLRSRPIIIDHAERDGIDGLISMVGAKWTTARAVAESAVDHCQRRLGLRLQRGGTERRPLPGARGSNFAGYDADSTHSADYRRDLYGTFAAEVDAIARDCPTLAAPLAPGSGVIGAQIAHAVRNEMALHLDDIVFRRTEMGTAGSPTAPELDAAARIAGRELGWTAADIADEIARVARVYEWGAE